MPLMTKRLTRLVYALGRGGESQNTASSVRPTIYHQSAETPQPFSKTSPRSNG